MNRTITHTTRICTDLDQDDALYGLREEFGAVHVDSKFRMGCLDAPNAIPSGCCKKYFEDDYTSWVFQGSILFRGF